MQAWPCQWEGTVLAEAQLRATGWKFLPRQDAIRKWLRKQWSEKGATAACLNKVVQIEAQIQMI